MGVNPRILSTADWHLHHPRVPTADTIADIRKYLFPYLLKTDILFINGDIFDTSVSMNSDCAPLIISLFADLFALCFDNNVTLRVLQGTYTHDRNQLRILAKLYTKLGLKFDFKIINAIEVEYLEKFKKHVLYLPDNLPYKQKSDVFIKIQKLMTIADITKVDYAVVHGEFEHACHGYGNDSYTVEEFEAICKGWVSCGHIHKPTREGIVLYSGSVNRLAHNEEENKGFWYITDKPKFVVNQDATKFMTLRYSSKDLDSILHHHRSVIEKYFDNERAGFIRLIIDDIHLRQAVRGFHIKHFPNIKLTFKSSDSKVNKKYLENKLQTTKVEQLEVPSKKNIASIVCKHLMTRNISMKLDVVENIINGGN